MCIETIATCPRCGGPNCVIRDGRTLLYRHVPPGDQDQEHDFDLAMSGPFSWDCPDCGGSVCGYDLSDRSEGVPA